MTLEFTQQIFKKYSYIKFYKNPSSGSRDVPFGWTELMAAFRKFCETRLKGEYQVISYAKGGVRHCSRPPFVIVSCLMRGLQSAHTHTHTHTHTHIVQICSKFGASNEESERFVSCEKLEDRQFNTPVQQTGFVHSIGYLICKSRETANQLDTRMWN